MSTGGDASAVVDDKNMLNEKSLELNVALSKKKNREQVRSPETGKETAVNEKLVNLHDTSDT